MTAAKDHMEFRIRRGLDVPFDGVPEPVVSEGREVSSVAVTRADLRGLKPDVLVSAGEMVARGQPLFAARHDPQLLFAAPAAGRVTRIDSHHSRSFQIMEIACEGDAAVSFGECSRVRELLQRSGLWTTLTARPFGTIPGTGDTAEAILVTAMDTNPLAADPKIVIENSRQDFEEGLRALASLECDRVVLCQAPGPSLATGADSRVATACFSGPHPAGLPGTHLDRLGLRGCKIWQIGYQDVIAIGYLRRTGEIRPEWIVALGGPMARNPRLLRTRRGANLAELTQDETLPGEVVIVSGSALSGRPATHLGHLDCQICLLPAKKNPKRRAYAQHEGRPNVMPMTPSEAFEGLMPQKILPVPLMRALAVGNWDLALSLGAMDLVEEDVALLSALCTSGLDYGMLLRQALAAAEGAPL